MFALKKLKAALLHLHHGNTIVSNAHLHFFLKNTMTRKAIVIILRQMFCSILC